MEADDGRVSADYRPFGPPFSGAAPKLTRAEQASGHPQRAEQASGYQQLDADKLPRGRGTNSDSVRWIVQAVFPRR